MYYKIKINNNLSKQKLEKLKDMAEFYFYK
jgi:hypothetical protein